MKNCLKSFMIIKYTICDDNVQIGLIYILMIIHMLLWGAVSIMRMMHV